MFKKIFIVIPICLILACSNKTKAVGNRQDIFVVNTSIEIAGNPALIKLETKGTFLNYYGDNSILNSGIVNYDVKNLNFTSEYLSMNRFTVNNYFFSSPIILEDILYYVDTNGNLIARNLKTFKKIWKKKIIERAFSMNYYGAKLSIYEDTIYISTRVNEIIAISIEGNIKWRKKINSVPISAPVIENDSVFLITNDNKLYCFNTEDGTIKWISYGNVKDSAILGSANPVIYKNYVIASYSSGELFIINKLNGETILNLSILGRYSIFSSFELTDIDSTPKIKNNILIATANNGTTTAMNLDTLKVIWKQNLASLTNIIINDNFVYLITTENILICLNLHDGKINWFKAFDKLQETNLGFNTIFYKSIIFVNDKIIAFNNIKEYKIINAYNGEVEKEELLKFTFYNIPFSVNNVLYGLANQNGNLVFIKSGNNVSK